MTHQSRWSVLAAGFVLMGTDCASAMTVELTPSFSSPAPLGMKVTFTAAVADAASSHLWYRFRVRRPGTEYQLIRDYGPANSLDWTAARHEGAFEMEVTARDLDTGDTSTAVSLFQFQSLVTDGQPVVSPTGNSLVFLYSAPPCEHGSRMRVEFQTAGATSQATPYQACPPGLSMNFYLAGMIANTSYNAHHVVDTGLAFVPGPDVTFTTGDLPANLYTDTIMVLSAP